MTRRRDFLLQVSTAAAAAMALDAAELRAATTPGALGTSDASTWDTSWLDRLKSATYRVVFNANNVNEGAALDLTAVFMDHYHEVHDTRDAQTRAVMVFRQLGTPLAFNDAMWDRYALGEETKTNDASTRAPAKRNVYWKAAAGAPPEDSRTKLETLHSRGAISLVCTIAANNWGSSLARKHQLDAEEVRKDLKANLVPGAILVPSGIFALIRAQNAGCAFMQGG